MNDLIQQLQRLYNVSRHAPVAAELHDQCAKDAQAIAKFITEAHDKPSDEVKKE